MGGKNNNDRVASPESVPIHLYCPTNGTVLLSSAVMHTKDADRKANSVEPDQTAP